MIGFLFYPYIPKASTRSSKTIDTITLPGLETEVAVADVCVSRDVISHTTVTLFSST